MSRTIVADDWMDSWQKVGETCVLCSFQFSLLSFFTDIADLILDWIGTEHGLRKFAFCEPNSFQKTFGLPNLFWKLWSFSSPFCFAKQRSQKTFHRNHSFIVSDSIRLDCLERNTIARWSQSERKNIYVRSSSPLLPLRLVDSRDVQRSEADWSTTPCSMDIAHGRQRFLLLRRYNQQHGNLDSTGRWRIHSIGRVIAPNLSSILK